MISKTEIRTTAPTLLAEAANSTLKKLRAIAERLPPESPKHATAMMHIQRLEAIRTNAALLSSGKIPQSDFLLQNAEETPDRPKLG